MQFVILILALFYPLTSEAINTLLQSSQFNSSVPYHLTGFEVENDGYWTVDNSTHDIKKVSLTDGSTLKSIQLPFQDDVADLIVLKNGFFVSSGDKVYRLKKDGSIIHTIEVRSNENKNTDSRHLREIIWDGRSLWTIADDSRLYRVSEKDGKVEKTLYLSIPQEYLGLSDLSFSNGSIWISTSSSVYKISPDTGIVLSVFTFPGDHFNERNDLDFMNTHLWVHEREKIFIYTLPDSPEALNFSPLTNWFKPELIENNDTICSDVLTETTNRFYSDQVIENTLYRGPLLSSGTTLTDDHNAMITIGEKQLYITAMVNSGCGGACETYTLKASTEPFPENDRWSYNEKAILQPEPPASANPFLTMINGRYFLPVVEDNNLNIFELKSDHWKTACKIRVKPENLDQFNDETTLDLELAFRGDSGYGCGSMATHSRWGRAINENIEQAFYQPWALHEYGCSKDSDDCYENDMENLKQWALTGIAEYNMYQNHLEHFEIAVDKLAKFYIKHNGWSDKASKAMAREALETAVSSGTRFYMYNPFKTQEETELRRAILEKRPIEEIRKINTSAIDKSSEYIGSYNESESILNVAVTYPEALAYLLEAGFDPNAKNTFDKTPLMYAAQYDGYESAKLLIEAGATINTGTIIPYDNCGYTIKTSNMSPLHYAVRYASKNLIELLLDNGASRFFDVRNEHNYLSTIERPVDWLRRFVNEKLSEDERLEIEQRLKMSEVNELAELSLELNIQGEKFYAEKKLAAAREKFREATQVDSENINALNNFALTSLKMDDKQRSLQASTRVIESKKSTEKQKASAYFNIGLACEGEPYYGLMFDGMTYCRDNALENFVKSYNSYPTAPRANAIVKRFDKVDQSEFSCKANNAKFEAVYKRGNDFHFLHKHPMEEIITDVERLTSRNNSFDIERKQFTLIRKATTDLQNGYYISTYKSDISIGEAFAFQQGVCTTFSSKLLVEENKLVYIHASDSPKEIDIEFDVNKPYTIILSGNVKWNVTQTGSARNEFIINNGSLFDSEGMEYTLIKNMHREWSADTGNNQYISSSIRSSIGKPIYTRFKIFSNSKIIITDEDINQPKLIISWVPNLDFYGIGSYQIAFNEPIISFNNKMNLKGIQFVTDDVTQIGRADILYTPNLIEYMNNSDNFYFRVEEWSRDFGKYLGDGYFKK